jgi:hypothetical protein
MTRGLSFQTPHHFKVWIAQCEREIAGEEQFLSKAEPSDDELLAALS